MAAPSIQDLRERRRTKYEEARALVGNTPTDQWTSATQAKYDALVREMDALDDQIFRHDRILSDIATNISGGLIPAARPRRTQDPEHMEAFNNWVRLGDDSGLRQFRVSDAMTTGTGSQGGFLVPEQWEQQIDRLASDQSAMRSICEVRKITTPEYRRLLSLGKTVSGWVGETETRDETDISDLTMSSPYWGAMYAQPCVSQDVLDFSFYDVEGFITQEVGESFATQEGDSFISGDGVKKPRGILAFPFTAEADGGRAFGTLKYEASGAASAIGGFDALQNLAFSPRRAYRKNATWLMNSTTAGTLSKIKDNDDNYIWQRSVAAGQPPTLLGYPVEIDDFMPDVAADAIPILFGDFRRAFMITDLPSIALIRDPYTRKGFILFYFLKRVGTLLKNSEAVRGLKIAA